MGPDLRRRLRPLATLACLCLATALLYGDSLRLWWAFDDPAILLHAWRYAPQEYFFVPSAWQALIPYSLQPWLSLSYDLDLSLFGFRPALFFAHHLLAMALCAWCLQRVAAQWVGEAWGLAAGLLFLVGTPLAMAAQQLMVRHYLEGLMFYLLGLWLLLRRLRGGSAVNMALSGLAFAVAASAKEIFLPLGLLPFVLPLADWRLRLRAAWPWALVMTLYVPWRYHMLGQLLGGYVPQGGTAGLNLGELWQAFAGVPALLWAWPAVGLAAALALLALAWPWLRAHGRAMLPWLLPLPALLLLPLLPLVRFPGIGAGSERYFMAPWAVLAVLAALLLGLAWRRWPGGAVRALLLALYCALLLPAWQLSRNTAAQLAPLQAAHKALGMALVHGQPGDVIQGTPGVSTWFIQGLLDLRGPMGQSGPAPRLAADESDLAGADLAGARVLRYDPASAAMQDVTAQQAAQLQAWRQRLRPDLAFSVATAYDGRLNAIRWQLSAPVPGSFAFLSQGGALALPAQGAIRRDTAPTGCFRIRFQTADGSLAYSPLLQWPVVATGADAQVTWQGVGDRFNGPPAACAAAAPKPVS
jgi:hypothetical protein